MSRLETPPPEPRSAEQAIVPARMINEILYCERLFYIEWCQGEFEDNAFTVDGRLSHRRADVPGGRLPPTPPTLPRESEDRPGPVESHEGDEEDARPYRARSVWLTSATLGITAKIDVVEGDGAEVVPIEYKRGSAPDLPEGAYLPERAQICAQVLLLREQGYRCERGAIYFAKDRKRVEIGIDEALIARTIEAARRARELAERGVLPPPLVDSPKCNGCSLSAICLPDEVRLLREQPPEQIDEPEPIPASPERQPARRLYAARDDRLPLYVQSHKARISVSGERILVREDDQETVARLPNTSQVVALGNPQITTPALKALLERDIPVSLFTFGGWFLGRTMGLGSKNIELRIAQHRTAADPKFALRIARRLVAAKILNCRTLLMRNHPDLEPVVRNELRILATKALRAEQADSLLGLEGTAARTYFEAFSGMLKAEPGILRFDLKSRNRRPPRDPVNALLSFCYALLTKDLTLALHAVGLDPLLGFYHRPRHGRPALALDLMEEFRPLIADSVVLGVINNGVVAHSDFIHAGGGCAMSPAARKRVIAAYERRMDQLITHPVFEYRLSYRRVLELQARLLTRVIQGELEEYPWFRTR